MTPKALSREDEVKQLLMQKMVDHWLEDNKGLAEDIQRLSAEFVRFNALWGTRFSAKDIIGELTKENK